MEHELLVRLELVTSGNPFAKYPQLRSIWSSRDWSVHVEMDTVADLKNTESDPAQNRIYTVFDEDGHIVGLTGFYLLDFPCAGLRWHGIIPEFRGRGFSKAAFRKVCQEARVTSSAQRIIEYVEMADTKAPALIKHFAELGFKATGEAKDATLLPKCASLPDNSGKWLEMAFVLHPVQMCGKFIM